MSAIELNVLETLFQGRSAYGGLDLSATTDLTSFALVFPLNDLFHVLPYFWIPAEGIRERSQRDRVPYQQWVDEGFIELTPGNATDYRYVTRKIIDLGQRFQIKQIGYDRWGAPQVSQELMDAGIDVVSVGQGYSSLSAPTKFLQELVLGKRLRHYANPVLRWNAECLTVSQDPAGNIKPMKPERHKSSKRIDGMVALIMALAVCGSHHEEKPVESGTFWISFD